MQADSKVPASIVPKNSELDSVKYSKNRSQPQSRTHSEKHYNHFVHKFLQILVNNSWDWGNSLPAGKT